MENREINSKWLDISTFWELCDAPEVVELGADVEAAIVHCHNYLQQRAGADGDPVYGVNTGFGDLASTQISKSELGELQRRILLSHACGVGELVPDAIVRAMLLTKSMSLSKGHSGVALSTVERLLAMRNHGVLPVVPSQGSLGASGDLAPLAHLVLPLIGEGEVIFEGERMSSAEALKRLQWAPLELGAKEGLALINGTQLMLSYGLLALRRAERLADWADALAAWSLEAWHGRSEPFDERIHRIRNASGAMIVASKVRNWIAGSAQQAEPRTQVQDPYSFRCVPQVHGASRDSMAHVRTVLEAELNAVTDNPLIFPDDDLILSGGNFHGQPLALVLESLGLAVHEWASISERRIFKLMSGRNGLPPFLAENPGLNSGLMIPQYTAASLVSQNKQLTTPAAADTIDSSNGQEDHVSMGANGALKLWRILDNAEQVLAIECLAASTAMDLRGTEGMAPALAALQESLRKRVPYRSEDVWLAPVMAEVKAWMDSQDLAI